ncbi:putative membrane protein insertion efficiency factor [compost metagenome]
MKKYSIIKVLKYIIRIPVKIEIWLIDLYKKYISKSLGKRCIYYPTCSEYTRQAVDKYGIIKGNVLGIYRILRCNPFAKGGIDYLK